MQYNNFKYVLLVAADTIYACHLSVFLGARNLQGNAI